MAAACPKGTNVTEEMKAKDATRYMVLSLPDMGAFGGPFSTEGEARKCAEDAAKRAPGIECGIYQKALVARAELVVETKGIVG